MSTATYSVAPNPFDYGRVKVGTSTPAEVFTITNTSPIFSLVVDNCIIFNLTGGGQVIVGCGQGAANGTTVALPAGFAASRCILFTTPGNGNGADQLDGIEHSTGVGGVFSSVWQLRSGGASGNPCTTNYVLAAWTAGAAVTLTTVGTVQQLSFTTDQGDPICIAIGSVANGAAFPVPAGFSAANALFTTGIATTDPAGNGWQYVHQCDLAVGTLVATLVYIDSTGDTWFGSMNVLGIFYQTGGGVSTQAVANGTALLVAAEDTSVLSLIFATVHSGSSFGLPTGFSGVLSGMASATFGDTGGDNICHGFSGNTLSGTLFTGDYVDGSGHSWAIVASTLAVAVKAPNFQIQVNNIASNVGEFALTGLPAFPVILNPGSSLTFNCACTAAYQGLISYPQALTVDMETLADTFIALSYNGFLINSAYTLTGATKGVIGSLSGVWNAAANTYLAQFKSSLPCEADAYWETQYDFDNASANTYLNKVFLRNEPSGDVSATMSDTSMISGATKTVTCTTTQSGSTDGNKLVKWMQFDFENNGEAHLLRYFLAANAGISITSMIILQYELRGVVYEGT